MAQNIDIFVNAKNKASAALKQVTRDLQGLDKTAATAAQGWGAMQSALLAVGGVAGFGALAVGIGKASISLAQSGVEAQRAKEAFVLLSGGAAQAEGKLEAIRRASNGTISDLEAVGIANRAAALGYAKNAEELERLVGIMRISANLMGTDLASALDNIGAAASNLSFERLDTMGIGASAVRDEYNRLLEANSNLSKEAAFLEATLRVGEQTFHILEGSALATASGIERVQTHWTNLANSILEQGSLIDHAFAGIADSLDQIDIRKTEQNVQMYIAAMDNVREGSEEWIRLNALLQAEYAKLTHSAADAGQSAEELAEAERQAGIAAEEAAAGLISAANEAGYLGRMALSAASDVDVLKGKLDGLSPRFSAIEGAKNSAISQFQSQAMRAIDAGANPDEIIGMVGEVTDRLWNMPAAVDGSAESMFEFELSLRDAAAAESEVLDGIIDTERETKRLSNTSAGVNSEFSKLKTTIQGIISSATGPVAGVDAEDFFPREDAVNENARRLADIAVNGLRPTEWMDEFKSEVPGVFDEIANADDSQRAAQEILLQFQRGLRPELIDKGKVKDIVRRSFEADAQTKSLVDEIAGELAQEYGMSLGEAQQKVAGIVGGGSTSGGTMSASITPQVDTSGIDGATIAGQVKTAIGTLAVTPTISLALPEDIGFTDADKTAIGTAVVDSLGTFAIVTRPTIDVLAPESGPSYSVEQKQAIITAARDSIGEISLVFRPSVDMLAPTTVSIDAGGIQQIAEGSLADLPVSASAAVKVSAPVGSAIMPSEFQIAAISGTVAAAFPSEVNWLPSVRVAINPAAPTTGGVSEFQVAAVTGAVTAAFPSGIPVPISPTFDLASISPADASEGDGPSLGEQFASAFVGQVGSSSLGADTAGIIFTQITASVAVIESAGQSAGKSFVSGFLASAENLPGDFLNLLAGLITPIVISNIGSQGGRTGAESE